MRAATPWHINLVALAIRVINAGEAGALAPQHEIVTQAEYVNRVVEALRRERIALTDAEFRSRYCKHF